MSPSTEAGCGSCLSYAAHPLYEWLGYCALHRRLVCLPSPPCPEFRPPGAGELAAAIESRGFVYCSTCRLTIPTAEEAAEHASMGHSILTSLVEEEGLHEEVYAGD